MGNSGPNTLDEYIKIPLDKNWNYNLNFFVLMENYDIVEKNILSMLIGYKMNDTKYNEYKYTFLEQEHKIEIYENKYLKWKFFIGNSGLTETNLNFMIKTIKKNISQKKYYNIILVFCNDPNYLGNLTRKICSKTNKECFFIFISDSNVINENDLKNDIILPNLSVNKNINELNFKLFKYNENEAEKNKMKEELMKHVVKIMSYYNELGDFYFFPDNLFINDNEKLQKYNFDYIDPERLTNPYNINILVCGRPGCGKSTLINEILGEKKCKSGTSGSGITQKISHYLHKEKPAIFYDSPGFDENNKVERVISLIKKLNSDMLSNSDKIHCVLFVKNLYDERDFQGDDEKLIEYIFRENIPIFFVFTHFIYQNKWDECKKNFLIEISNFVEKCNLDQDTYNDQYFEKHLITVNLKQEKLDDKIIPKKINDFYNKIYESFRNDLINEEEINKILKEYRPLKKIKDKINDAINDESQRNDKIRQIRDEINNFPQNENNNINQIRDIINGIINDPNNIYERLNQIDNLINNIINEPNLKNRVLPKIKEKIKNSRFLKDFDDIENFL